MIDHAYGIHRLNIVAESSKAGLRTDHPTFGRQVRLISDLPDDFRFHTSYLSLDQHPTPNIEHPTSLSLGSLFLTLDS